MHISPQKPGSLSTDTINRLAVVQDFLYHCAQTSIVPCRLYLQTKLANPHYKPEIAAQTTLVNFCVTEVGLEEQLLAQVVGHERPDLQEQARSLVRQLGEYTITLKELEDNLLQRLANSQVSLTWTVA